MRKIKQLVIFGVFFVVSIFQTTTNAQFKDYSHKFGLSGHYLIARNEFGGNGYLGRIFSRLQLNSAFDLELGAGYGWFGGEDYGGNSYKTEFVPIDLRLMISPFSGDSWNPYIFVGVGGVGWWLDDPPSDPARPPEDKYEDINFLVPVGIGTEIALSKTVALDMSFGWSAIINDWPNGLATNDENLWHHDWDRYFTAGLGISFSGDNCGEDADNDGLDKCQEEEIGTDPYNADTDGDGLKDGEEVMDYDTDPLKTDSNGDGLTDYEKVKIYDLDPNLWDNDSDGLNDYDEIKVHSTDAKNPDTDAEGLNDGDEVNTHKTNPNKSDTDIDGLSDYAEVMTHKTDPLNKDSDGGSIMDGVEVKQGTDPLNPADDVEEVQIAVPIVLDGISFATASAEITSSSRERLQEALHTMNSHPNIIVEIRGYCDNTGARSFNMKLSQRRAESVRTWLINQGVKSNRLTAKGFGPDNPIATNKTAEGRKRNRRIEFVRIK